MKECIFILPYFGKLKNYFNMFLESCSYNENYNWLIITDQQVNNNYTNIIVKNMSFEDFVNKVQNKFDFEILLSKPYKLCDYKPTYGYIFEDYIKEYKYWAHCDCDVIFGNLEKFLSPILQQDYDKIFAAGHLTIYKNTFENNRRFMGKSISGKTLYNKVFTHEKIFGFDEDYFSENIHSIFKNSNCKIYDKDLAFNILPTYYNIVRGYYNASHERKKWLSEKKKLQILCWDRQGVYSLTNEGNKLHREEYLYVHLLMRKMKNTISDNVEGVIQICPDSFRVMKNNINNIREWEKSKKFFFSIDIIKKFLNERKFDIKRKGKIDSDINPYLGFID